MLFVDLIRKKRDGGELTAKEIRWMVEEFSADRLPDYQMAAWLMAAWLRGIGRAELTALTEAMLRSGLVLEWSGIGKPVADKHSTGGVGDKTSLIIAPLAAECGLAVPMISGRGLGHTGGTLDKLEAIPGFKVSLEMGAMRAQMERIGVAMVGQSEDLVPADKRLYALRDVTATVESAELICASIMSKKVAEGLDALVLDVKTGTGAFMSDENDARHLAKLMVETGEALGLKVAALLTDMNQPLGRAVGNALEVVECTEVLRGEGPKDVRTLSVELTAWMLYLADISVSIEAARRVATEKLESGAAYERFCEMVRTQGGDVNAIKDPNLMPQAKHRREYVAKTAGFMHVVNCRAIGMAALVLGGGRERKEDAIDPAVGLMWQKPNGERVEAGEMICEIHYNGDARLGEAMGLLESAYEITAESCEERPLTGEVITSANVASGTR